MAYKSIFYWFSYGSIKMFRYWSKIVLLVNNLMRWLYGTSSKSKQARRAIGLFTQLQASPINLRCRLRETTTMKTWFSFCHMHQWRNSYSISAKKSHEREPLYITTEIAGCLIHSTIDKNLCRKNNPPIGTMETITGRLLSELKVWTSARRDQNRWVSSAAKL